MAFTTGERDGELAGLQLIDLFLTATIPHLRVERAVALRRPRGRATLSDPKTEENKRTVPLAPAAAAALKLWLDEGWEQFVERRPQRNDFVFPRSDGESWRPRSADLLRGDLARISAATQVEGYPLTFHATRRTFSTARRDAGVSLEIRQRLLGHGGGSVAERHYTEAELRLASAAVGRIPLAWPPVQNAVRTEGSPAQRTPNS